LVVEVAGLSERSNSRRESPESDHIHEDQGALDPSAEAVRELPEVGEAHEVAEAVANEARKEIARAQKQERRVDAEEVRVGELKAVLHDQQVEGQLVGKVALHDVVQMGHAKEEGPRQNGLGEAQLVHEQREHARPEHELFGEWADHVVAPKGHVAHAFFERIPQPLRFEFEPVEAGLFVLGTRPLWHRWVFAI